MSFQNFLVLVWLVVCYFLPLNPVVFFVGVLFVNMVQLIPMELISVNKLLGEKEINSPRIDLFRSSNSYWRRKYIYSVVLLIVLDFDVLTTEIASFDLDRFLRNYK